MKIIFRIFLYVLYAFVFWTHPTLAQEITVTATVDRNQMRAGDTFTYSISISSENSVAFEQPKLPDLSAFEVINVWSGSEMRGTFSGGQVQTIRSQTFNYMLAARSTGAFTIAAAEVSAGGQIFRTNPISVQVLDGAPQAPPMAQQPTRPSQPRQAPPQPRSLFDEEDDLFSQLLRRREQQFGLPVDPNEAFFIHLDVDKTKVYVGEQVTASWYLVTRSQIADIDTLKYPALSGFWKEDIELATRLNFRPEIINGLQYNKALLVSYALFPIKEGILVVDEYEAKCRVIQTASFAMPRESHVTKSSQAVKIEALALPTEGRPEGFTGAVGEFDVSGNYDTRNLKAHEPFTLKFRIDGRGNAKVADLPSVEWPEGIEVYDSKAQSKFYPNGRSYKDFEVLLVPRKDGPFSLPDISFHFFDPKRKAYYTRVLSGVEINVAPNENKPSIESNPLAITSDGQSPVRRELPQPVFNTETTTYFSTPALVGIWSSFYGLGLLGLAFYGRKQFQRQNRRESLLGLIRRRMKQAENLSATNKWREFGIELTNITYQVLGEVAGLGGASYEISKLMEKAPPSFRRQVGPQIEALMKKLEVLAFAPETLVGDLKNKKNLTLLAAEAEKILKQATEYDFSEGRDD